jgi:cytochrome P450
VFGVFGTVFGVADGKPLPFGHYTGFPRFGSGYRRCSGEQLMIMVMEGILRKVWRENPFQKLKLPNAEKVPIGPNA